MPRYWVPLLACAAALLAAAPARAEVFAVNATADHAADACDDECTVRDAIAAADAAAGADTVTVPPGTYDLASALPIAGDLTVTGPATDEPPPTLDVGYRDRVFEVFSGAVTLSRLRIARGQAPEGGSALLQHGGTVTLDHDAIEGHVNNTSGGALLLLGGTLNVTDTEVSGNSGYSGGGLYVGGGSTANLDRTLWLSNHGSRGGAIYNAGGTLTVANSTFAANQVNAGHGGAIYTAGNTTLRNVTFEANIASGNEGGGSALWSDAVASTANVVFGNSAYQDNCGGLPPSDRGGSVDAGTSCRLAASGRTVMLGPLASNGGAARSLLPWDGSAGIDAGDDEQCTGFDQRMFRRARSVDDRCDAGAVEGSGGPAPKPLLSTGDAHDATADAVQVDASIDRGGLATTFRVDYGLTVDYATSTYESPVGFGPGAGAQPVTGFVTGLAPSTTYHYRVVATSAAGTTRGDDRTFTTAAADGPSTYTVAALGDSGGTCSGSAPRFTCDSLRVAVQHADEKPGSDAVVLTTAGTYMLYEGELAIGDDLAIVGQGARKTTIQANGDIRVLSVSSGVQASVSLVTLANGYGGAGEGGNIRNLGDLVLAHARVTGGRAGEGGGIANLGGATLHVASSLVDHNTATSRGGGIANIGGGGDLLGAALTVVNSTIAFNAGGGIASTSASDATLVATTIARNDGGGLGVHDTSSTDLYGSLIASNAGGNCIGEAAPRDGGYNLESGTDCGLNGIDSRQEADPGLSEELVNAGGETDVLTLAATSPAVDLVAECAVSEDQRGARRPGRCDAGAYELANRAAPATPTVTAGPPETTTETSAVFEFAAAGAAGFECRLDGPGRDGAFRRCSSPATFDALAPGAYTFTVRSVDGAGAPSAQTASRSFSVAVAAQQTPAPTPTPTPAPAPAPTPEPGKSVVGTPVSGKVLVKRPGGKGFVEVDAAQGIPLGSIVDARNGVIELTARPGQTARFSEGIFKVTQTRGTTDLTLTEALAKCGKGARAAAKKPKTRKLWGEGSGSFRTRGQYSAATVRGTKWLVQDSCAGTLTRVAKGVVAVRDEVRRKTIVLRAGGSYLAKPR